MYTHMCASVLEYMFAHHVHVGVQRVHRIIWTVVRGCQILEKKQETATNMYGKTLLCFKSQNNPV